MMQSYIHLAAIVVLSLVVLLSTVFSSVRWNTYFIIYKPMIIKLGVFLVKM